MSLSAWRPKIWQLKISNIFRCSNSPSRHDAGPYSNRLSWNNSCLKPSHKTGFWKGFWSWLTLFSHLVFFSLMFWFHSGLEIRLVRKAMRALWRTRKRRSLPVEIFVWWDFFKKACPCKFKWWAGQIIFLIHFVAHRWSFMWQDNLGMTQGEIAIKLPCHKLVVRQAALPTFVSLVWQQTVKLLVGKVNQNMADHIFNSVHVLFGELHSLSLPREGHSNICVASSF